MLPSALPRVDEAPFISLALALDGTTQLGDAVGAIPASIGGWSQADGLALVQLCTLPPAAGAGIHGARPAANSEWLFSADNGSGVGRFRSRHRDTANTSIISPSFSNPTNDGRPDSAGYVLVVTELDGTKLRHRFIGVGGESTQEADRVGDGTLTRLVLGATEETGGRGELAIAMAAVIALAGGTTPEIRAALYGDGTGHDWSQIPGADEWLARYYVPQEGAEVTTTLVVPDRGAMGLAAVDMVFAATSRADLVPEVPTGVAP
jgi:hypothetical protein